MIMNRIKLARQAHCYSLQDLADILSQKTLSVTRATLSHYENGRIQPTEKTLIVLSRALGVTRPFFDKEDWTDFSLQFQHCPAIRTEKLRQELYSYLQIELERYLDIDSLLGLHSAWLPPDKTEIEGEDVYKIEEIVSYARSFLKAGGIQVASVCTMLENSGWYLLCLPPFFGGVDNLSGVENSHNMPFLTYKIHTYSDDFRLQLLKELGYFFLRSDDEQSLKGYTEQFARAFLMPRELAVADFGRHRSRISYSELSNAKMRYGMGRVEILKRLLELEIITTEHFDEFYAYIDQHAYISRESAMGDDIRYYEAPASYKNKVSRAYSEGLIDRDSEHVLPEWHR